jgi:hypothetical protein
MAIYLGAHSGKGSLKSEKNYSIKELASRHAYEAILALQALH